MTSTLNNPYNSTSIPSTAADTHVCGGRRGGFASAGGLNDAARKAENGRQDNNGPRPETQNTANGTPKDGL